MFGGSEQAHVLSTLPQTPGVYLFRDTRGRVLYVGKAKLLKARVSSYFRSSTALEPAKHDMVGQIAAIDTISTATENEALVLEANLIQKYQPPYNVVLRDDKYYLFIKITPGPLPRVFPVRRLKRDGARYFGPYSSAYAVRETLKLLRRLFPFREERDRPRDHIFPHPLFAQNATTYQQNIHNIIRFLKGERDDIIETLRTGMQAAAARLAYEQAALWRNQLRMIERLDQQQNVYLPRMPTLDIISVAHGQLRSAANVFSIRRGKLLDKNTFLLQHRGTAQLPDIVRQFMLHYYRVAQDIPPTIAVPTPLDDSALLAQWINPGHPVRLIVPRRGRLKALVELGERNAAELLRQEHQAVMTAERGRRAVQELAQALQLSVVPERIETYDISNIQGRLATGSLVVFTAGQAQPKEYKRFKIRLTHTPNDFVMLQEVLTRRFAHHAHDWPLPDLIMIDGGKGQLSAAHKILKSLAIPVPVISLAKREEELFIPGRAQSVRLAYDCDALYLVQRMRDEAHRFTLTYHRLLRSQHQKRSLLDEIPGIGPKTKARLLRHFGSLKAIRAASGDERKKIIGTKADLLQDYL